MTTLGNTILAVQNNLREDILARVEQTRDDVTALKSSYQVIQRDMLTLTSAIEKLVARFEDSRKLNWPLLALVTGLLPLVIGGFAYFMTSYSAGAVAPIHAELIQNETNLKALSDIVREIATTQQGRSKDLTVLSQTTNTNSQIIDRMTNNMHEIEGRTLTSVQADINSQTDRKQLNDRMTRLEQKFSTEETDRRSQYAATQVQLGEIEQQFHSVSNLENLRAAQQERLNSMMWEKSHPGERYPNQSFFPTSIFQGPGGSSPIDGVRSSPKD